MLFAAMVLVAPAYKSNGIGPKRFFDNEFIKLARAVYKNNDQRSDIKRKINIIYKSDIIEEKSYK